MSARVDKARADLEVEVSTALITGVATKVEADPERAEQQLKTRFFGVLEFDGAATDAAAARTRLVKAVGDMNKATREMAKYMELRINEIRLQSDAIMDVVKRMTLARREQQEANAALDGVRRELRVVSDKIAEVTSDLEVYRRTSILVIHRDHVLAVDDCIQTSTEELAQLKATQEVLRARLDEKQAIADEILARRATLLDQLGSMSSSPGKRKSETSFSDNVDQFKRLCATPTAELLAMPAQIKMTGPPTTAPVGPVGSAANPQQHL